MRLTIVNTHDIIGGAERCSYDLAQELCRRGDDVTLLVGRKLGRDPFVEQMKYHYPDYKFRQLVFGRFGLTDTTLVAPLFDCYDRPALARADLYNIHNMHGAYWNFWTLPILARRAPIVLTLHDEWILTGDCAYTYDCDRWAESCGRCPQATIPSAIDRYGIGGRDTTRINLALKRWCLDRVPQKRLTLVSPSRWLIDRAQRAPHLRRFPFRHVPYGIDLEVYRPLDRSACRQELGLPPNDLLLFVSAANLADRRKNFRLVTDLVASGGLPRGVTLVVAGRSNPEMEGALGGRARYLGFITERRVMVTALSACDAALVFSLADNLPYSAIEALACGCPVIGSITGGIPELIEDGESGWLLPASSSPADLARLLVSMTELPAETMRSFSLQARMKARERHEIASFGRAYGQIFEQAVDACASR